MNPFRLVVWIPLIEFIGSLVIVSYVAGSLLVLWRERGAEKIVRARLVVAGGALIGLGFKLAATLLKTVQLHSWAQIGAFLILLLLRELLKQIFAWEQARIRRNQTSTQSIHCAES